MEALRVEGNALFTAKQYAAAIEKYTDALALQPTDVSAQELASQRLVLWSNRAACLLPLNEFEKAAADCTKALEVDPRNEKARYRRAQAFVGLGKNTEAFQDVRFVLALNPSNKAVVALARKIKDVVQSDIHGVQKALDAVTKGVCDGGGQVDALLQEKKAVESALQFLEMKCVQELVSLPREVVEKGGLIVLWRAVKNLLVLLGGGAHGEEEEEKKASQLTAEEYEAVGSVLSHVVGLLAIVSSASLALAAQVYDSGGAVFQDLLALLRRQVESSYASSSSSSSSSTTASPMLSMVGRKHIVKLAAFVFKHLMLTSDDDPAIRMVLKSVLDGLRSREVDLQISGLDGLLHFLSSASQPPSSGGGSEEEDAATATTPQKRFGTLVQEIGLFPLLHETASIALHFAASADHASSRYDVLLSRLPLVFTQCLAQVAHNESLLKQLVRDFCVSPVVSVTTSGAASSTSPPLEKASASCLLLSALFLSNAKLALWGVQQTSHEGTFFLMKLCDILVASRTFDSGANATQTRRFQEIWVDCVASVCGGVETGTSCVPSSLRQEISKMLHASMDSQEELVLRASALSIQIKISIVEKAFETQTSETQFLIDQVFDVLEKAHLYEQKALENQLFWSGASPKERGIEALSYLITLTNVKDTFVLQHPKAITSVFDIDFAGGGGSSNTSTISSTTSATGHAHVGYRSNVYYGIGYILHHVLTSEATLKKKQMEGMELTPEQYEELQKAMRQKSALDDGDSQDAVQKRVAKLIQVPCVVATLLKLLKFTTTKSQNVLEMATLSALHASENAQVRGKLVQSGILAALIPLSMHGYVAAQQQDKDKKHKKLHTGTKISNAAGQAIAKILISTNPNLVPSTSLLSCIKPLLELCKGDTQLLQFEALMALTNIASVSEETKNRIVGEPQGLSTLQYLQFSEHELVRRASTETICNLLPNDQVIEKVFLNADKMRLWLAFASVEEEEEDFETARAAAGALAMVSQVPQVSWLMVQHGGLEAFARVVQVATHEDTVHRALFALENMLLTLSEPQEKDEDEAKKKEYVEMVKLELQEPLVKHLQAIVLGGKEAANSSFREATTQSAQSCLSALIKCIGKE